MSEQVEVPGVRVNLEPMHGAEPMVIITTEKQPDHALIRVGHCQIEHSELVALFRVLATTIEENQKP